MTSDGLKVMKDDLQKSWREFEKAALDSAQKLRRGAEETASHLRAKAGANVADGLNAAGEAAREGFDSAADGLNKAVGQASAAFDEAARDGAKTLRRTRRSIGAQVAERPLETVLLAGVVGYLIGYAMAGRS